MLNEVNEEVELVILGKTDYVQKQGRDKHGMVEWEKGWDLYQIQGEVEGRRREVKGAVD